MRRNTSKDPTLNSGTALLLKPLLIQGRKVLACDWTPQTVNMYISIQGDRLLIVWLRLKVRRYECVWSRNYTARPSKLEEEECIRSVFLAADQLSLQTLKHLQSNRGGA